MGYGFAQPIGAAPSTVGDGALVDMTVSLPSTQFIAKDCSSFESILLAFEYFGNPVVPAVGDFLRIQVLWFTDPSGTRLLDVVQYEIPSTFIPAFAGKRHFATLPVHGKTCVVSMNGGSGGAPAPSVSMYALGSARVVTKAVFSSDHASFGVTDLVVLNATGGAVAPVTASPWQFGGLLSGPVTLQFVAQVGAGAQIGIRLDTAFGSLGIGCPPVTVQTLGVAGQYQASASGVFTPRHPLRAQIVNVGPGGGASITSWAMSIVRDEP